MYQSLYRKYRPLSFSEVYGQYNAKTILKNTIKKEQLSHAYLFFGPRGTGKTSIAKMFARICNCLNPIDGECCEKCANCLDSKQKNCVDIIEIDAASNNGVDEIRELKNKVNLVPSKLKYKVYIIDEVHMLSIGAFNALLKTLEEPPEHVIFILATTDYYKVPATIVSRCQCIEFKNIDNSSMFDRLKQIAKKEKIKISDDAINEIVNDSNGGMRDAIGLLDKVNSYTVIDSKITEDDVRKLIGTVSLNEVSLIVDNISSDNYELLLDKFLSYVDDGKDLLKILSDILSYMSENIVHNHSEDLMKKIKIIYKYYSEIKKASNKRVVIKMMIAELSSTNVRKNISREIFLDKKVVEKEEKSEKSSELNTSFSINARINNAFVNANKGILLDLKKRWKEFDGTVFDTSEGSFVCDLLDTMPVVASDKNILLASQYDSIVEKINQNVDVYQKILNEKLQYDRKIVAVIDQEWDKLKKEYSTKIKSGEKIEYLDESIIQKEANGVNKKVEKKDTMEQKARELFGEMLS